MRQHKVNSIKSMERRMLISDHTEESMRENVVLKIELLFFRKFINFTSTSVHSDLPCLQKGSKISKKA